MKVALSDIDISFVILNYNTGKETVECIRSIEDRIDTENYRIIVVDNNSADDSLNYIRNYIFENTRIEILSLSQNLGFAKGNNYGITYIMQNYSCKYIVVLNSDTELVQGGLYKRINEEYEKSKFAVLGPMITTINGRCDNSPHPVPSVAGTKREINRFKVEKYFIWMGLYRPYVICKKIIDIIHNKMSHKEDTHRYLDFSKYQRNVVLQGCFLVFSQDCINKIGGFSPKTFLYYEEPLLYLSLKKNDLESVYTPEICILHKDGKSVNSVSNTIRKKMLFINKCYYNSAKILLEEMEKMGW